MTLSRAQAATELGARLGRDWTAVGLSVADSTGNFKEVIDDTLRDMGVAESGLSSATVANANVRVFLRIAEVYAIEKALATARADWLDTTLDGGATSQKASQFVAALEKRLERAEAVATPLGYGAAATVAAVAVPTMTSGAFGLDVIEPEETAA